MLASSLSSAACSHNSSIKISELRLHLNLLTWHNWDSDPDNSGRHCRHSATGSVGIGHENSTNPSKFQADLNFQFQSDWGGGPTLGGPSGHPVSRSPVRYPRAPARARVREISRGYWAQWAGCHARARARAFALPNPVDAATETGCVSSHLPPHRGKGAAPPNSPDSQQGKEKGRVAVGEKGDNEG